MKTCLLSTVALVAALVLQADVHRWKSGPAGSWSTGSSWEEGSAPTAGDYVWIPSGVTAPANDTDLTLIGTLGGIDLKDTSSVLQLSITGTDAELGCVVTNAGKVVKNGAGTLKLTKTGIFAYLTTAGWEINDGMVQLPVKAGGTFYTGPMTVNAPGVLRPASGNASTTTWMKGLSGDGVLTNGTSTAVNVTINGGSEAEPYVFDGRVIGQVNFVMYGGWQNFTAEPNKLNGKRTHKLYAGTLGLAAIGGTYTSGSNVYTNQGSIGIGNYEFCGTGGIRNLGTDPYETWATFAPSVNADVQYECGFIDGGAHGGLTLWAPISFYSFGKTPLNQFALAGDGGTNVLRGNIVEANANFSSSSAIYLIKRGAGTWNMYSTTRANRGVIAVEDGTLQFGTLAAKGSDCSLGRGDRLYECYTGAVDANRKVLYSWLLGTSRTTGVLEYMGTNNVFCTNRLTAVNGTGGFAHSGAGRLALGGAGGLAATNTLVFAGNASTNYFFDIIDGNGTLGVRKEGDGEWNLGGNLAFTGGVDVRAGTLRLLTNPNYTWYRFNIKEKVHKDDSVKMDCGKFDLWNSSGIPQALGMTENAAANGRPTALAPGQYALDTTSTNCVWSNFSYDYPLSNLFNGLGTGFMRVQNSNLGGFAAQKYGPVYDKPETWMRIAMRLPTGSDPVTSYDIGSRWNKTSVYTNYNVCSWSVEGSCDGVRWTTLANTRNFVSFPAKDNSWCSDGTVIAAGHANHLGWTIASGTADVKLPNGLTNVTVAAGATLVTDKPVLIRNLTIAAAGGGTIDGFAFAADGTLNITGSDVPDSIAVAFPNATDLSNVGGWRVTSNGQPTRWKVTVTPTGVKILRPGLVIIVR